MSVMDQIRKLDEQKAQLLESAKKEALGQAHKAIKELAELGFHYRLVQREGGATVRSNGARGVRRAGIRENVLQRVTAHAGGVSRAALIDEMDAKGDKSAQQSISNALAALKKAGTIKAADGLYKA
jgi:hypothetical protein